MENQTIFTHPQTCSSSDVSNICQKMTHSRKQNKTTDNIIADMFWDLSYTCSKGNISTSLFIYKEKVMFSILPIPAQNPSGPTESGKGEEVGHNK